MNTKCSFAHIWTGGFISADPLTFVCRLSAKLADFKPDLTLDFLHEVAAALAATDKALIVNRVSCLQYMSPWMKNLVYFCNPIHPLYDKSGARIRDCVRTLSDLSLAFPEVFSLPLIY